ncbi:RNA polymerase II transcriptional coactivator KIWI-like [Phalaenopsis equestris]|uniref:RNA polymerase II transcriptional coactivator KIWI-like n=1 Tax=Phalaenopsis equestris TaxID=78828 RepID=UPI0009E48DB0|nr:RNA polymerase II transcriptional coactivator KIWI-like [Phalaenopsis equestris]
MWTKGKRYGDDSGAGHSEPPAKFTKLDSDDGSGDIVVCELSKGRRVTVRNWQGKVVVDIREFYIKDGKELPGKKGISLPLDQWEVLRDHVEEINEAVMENA